MYSKDHSFNDTKADLDSILLLSNPKENIEIIELSDDFLDD